MRKKIMIIFIMIICIMFFISTKVNAEFSAEDIFSQGDQFITDGKGSTAINEDEISNIFIPIAQVLVKVGTAVIAVVTVVLGIQYMVASPEDKAKLKMRLVTLVIATLVISGAQVIWATVYNFLESTL